MPLGLSATACTVCTATCTVTTSLELEVEADWACTCSARLPGAALPLWMLGTVTTAQTRRLRGAAMVPVLVSAAPVVEQLPAPPSARNAMFQPAGSAFCSDRS